MHRLSEWVFIHSIELIIVSYHLLAKLNIIHQITAEATVAYLGFHSGGGGDFSLARCLQKRQNRFSYFFLWRKKIAKEVMAQCTSKYATELLSVTN